MQYIKTIIYMICVYTVNINNRKMIFQYRNHGLIGIFQDKLTHNEILLNFVLNFYSGYYI